MNGECARSIIMQWNNVIILSMFIPSPLQLYIDPMKLLPLSRFMAPPGMNTVLWDTPTILYRYIIGINFST